MPGRMTSGFHLCETAVVLIVRIAKTAGKWLQIYMYTGQGSISDEKCPETV